MSTSSHPIRAGPVVHPAGPDAASPERLHLGARGAASARRPGLEPTVGDRVHEPGLEVSFKSHPKHRSLMGRSQSLPGPSRSRWM